MTKIVISLIKPNFHILGQKYGKDVSLIAKELKTHDVTSMIDEFELNKQISICDGKFILVNEDFEIIEDSFDNYSLSGDANVKVSIDCNLTKSLINEGIVRDMVRKVQNLRKESDFEVSDRINVMIKCANETFKTLENHSDYFKNETLCSSIKQVEKINFKNITTFKVKSENIELGIKKL